MLARQIRALEPSIDRYQEESDKIMATHPGAEIFGSSPGAGPAMAPRLPAASGSDRGRFESAIEIQQLSGIGPVTKRSGKMTVVQ